MEHVVGVDLGLDLFKSGQVRAPVVLLTIDELGTEQADLGWTVQRT